MNIKTKLKITFVSLMLLATTVFADLTIDPPSKVFCEGASITLSYTVNNPKPPNQPCCGSDASQGIWIKDSEEATWSGDVDENGVLKTSGSGFKSVNLEINITWKCDDGSTTDTFENGNQNYNVEAQGAFAGQGATVEPGAPPSHTLGARDRGLTYPEYVESAISACSDNSNWHAIVLTMKGNYSSQARLLPGEQEITGPSGNTTSANYCAQIRELKGLNSGTWFMLKAVEDHEAVHADRFGPALKNVGDQIAQELEQVTVADSGQGQQAAITEIKASNAFATALESAQQIWLQEVLQLTEHDHDRGGPGDTAAYAVLDPMREAICSYASTHDWPDCSDCP